MLYPSGRAPHVRVVWFIDAGEAIPRFVTAYPLKGDSHDRRMRLCNLNRKIYQSMD
ncbi:MAG: DUF6883 domain-containing protein [Thermodesulfobacteriota bacterium]